MAYLGNQITTVFPSSVTVDKINDVTYVPNPSSGNITGRRNILMNSAMMIAQRSTSTQFSGSNGYVCDRFECSNQTDGAITFSQSTDVPSGQGFINSTKINVDTADTSLAATQHALFQQKVEGLQSSHLMWGTSNAQNVTVSFWIKSSLTGTFTYYFLDESANSQSYVETFTIDSANTWQKIVLNIDGPTTGGTSDFPITNARSFFTGICLGVGATHQTSTTGSWHATANFAASTSSAVKLIGTGSANMYVTGWQMEVGTLTNTIFEHRSFGEELSLCQRYYQQLGSFPIVIIGGNNCQGVTQARVIMRAAPTVSTDGNTGRITDCNAADFTTGGLNPAVTANAYTQSGGVGWVSARFQGFGFTGGTSGDPGVFLPNGTSGKPLQMDAEL